MKIKAILFDLDGTLLPMNQEKFIETYLKLMAMRLESIGYDPKLLAKSMWEGVTAMVKNDGRCTNEEVFWKVFTGIHGEQAWNDKGFIDAFYLEEFNQVQKVCGFTPAAKEIIDMIQKTDKKLILATNPLFPKAATQNRIRWAGLKPEDFELYTTYEDFCHCKPNLQYYLDIMEKIGCKSEECLMVGNDVGEDMIAESIGMKVFLLTDCLINKKEEDINRFPHGSFSELKQFLKNIIS